MVQIGDSLLDARGPVVDPLALLALSPLQPMNAEKVTIRGLDDVLFGFVPPEAAELDKVGRISD